MIFKALTDPAIPANEGCFRPLDVFCPPGTVVSAERPAPTSICWELIPGRLAVSNTVPGAWQAVTAGYRLQRGDMAIRTRAR